MIFKTSVLRFEHQKRAQHRRFPMKLAKFLRTLFLENQLLVVIFGLTGEF